MIVAHLPEVVRLSLAVGTEAMAPLARALQEASLAFADSVMSRVSVGEWIPRQDLLSRLGFYTESLGPSEIDRLWEQHTQFLRHASTLAGLESVARFYLGDVSLKAGYPYSGSRFNLARSGSRVRLIASDPKTKVYFLKLASIPDPVRLRAAEATLKALAPEFSWTFSWPEPRPVLPTNPGPLHERRLRCPTFLR